MAAVIETEHQYRVTRAAAERFANALADLQQERDRPDGVHPLLRQAQEDAMRSELTILKAQIRAYDLSRPIPTAADTATQPAD